MWLFGVLLLRDNLDLLNVLMYGLRSLTRPSVVPVLIVGSCAALSPTVCDGLRSSSTTVIPLICRSTGNEMVELREWLRWYASNVACTHVVPGSSLLSYLRQLRIYIIYSVSVYVRFCGLSGSYRR